MSFLPNLKSQYVFNLPSDFVPKEINDLFMPLIELHHGIYEDIISYLNATILKVEYPGLSMDTPSQTSFKGKQLDYRESKPLQDLLNNRQLSVTFARSNGDFNYWILVHLFRYHYLNRDNYIKPFSISTLDLNRDVIFRIDFNQIIFKELSEVDFNYGEFEFRDDSFSATFNFNFHEISYSLNEKKKLINENDIFKITNDRLI